MSFFLRLLFSWPIKITSIALVILAISARTAPYFIDVNNEILPIIKGAIEKEGYNIDFDGKASLDITYQVKVVIPNIKLSSIIEKENYVIGTAHNVVFKISFIDLILGRRSISEVEIKDAKLNKIVQLPNAVDALKLSSYSPAIKSHPVFSLFSSKLESKKILKKVKITNITIYEKDFKNVLVSKLNFEGKHINDKIDIVGDFDYQEEFVQFHLDLTNRTSSGTRKINLTTKSNKIKIDLDANFYYGEDELNLIGGLKTEIYSPSVLISELVKILPFLKKTQKDYFEEPIEITSDIGVFEGITKVTDIKISSPYLNAKADIEFTFNDRYDLKINFNIDDIDITKFVSSNESSTSDEHKYTLTNTKYHYIDFSFIDNSNIDLKLTANNVTTKNIELENFLLDFKSFGSVIKRGNASFSLKKDTHDSRVTLTNIKLDQIDGTSLLLGDFSNEGNDINETLRLFNLSHYLNIKINQLNYKIKSKIIFSPKEISIFEIDGHIGNTGKFSGSIATKQGDISDYSLDLSFSDLKLNSFDLPLFKQRLYTLLTKSQDDNYLSYFRWFRGLSSSYNIKLEFKNTEFRNEKINNFISICKLSPAIINLKGEIESEFANGNYTLYLTTQAIKPILNLVVKGANLDFNRLKDLMFSFLDNKNLEDVNSQNISPTTPKQNWSDIDLNIFNIYKYAATFDVFLKNLKLYDQDLNNVSVTSRTLNDVLYIDNLYFGIYDGQFQTRGNISFYNPLLYQFSFNTSGLETKSLIANSFPNMNFIEGPLSIIGSAVSQGNSPKELIKNLSLSAKFAGSGMKLHGIEADKIVDIALKREFTEKDKVLPSLEKFLNEGDTEVRNLNGDIKINKGITETNNVIFNTRFSNASFAMLVDLNNLTLSSNTKFLFRSYKGNTIDYSIKYNSDLKESFQKEIDQNSLLKYVKRSYGIVTAQDLIDAKKERREAIDKQKLLNEDPDSKGYLYRRLSEQSHDEE